MVVEIRELKARLLEYLDRAAAGETIRVTDRGVPKVLIIPVTPVNRIKQGIGEGWISVGAGCSEPPSIPPVFPSRAGVRTVDIIEHDRGS